MPLDHLLRYVVATPCVAGVLICVLLALRSGRTWPRWSALAVGAAFLGVLAFNPNFPLHAPWTSYESALPWAFLAWAICGMLPGSAALVSAAIPAVFLSRMAVGEVAEYYEWNALQALTVVALSTLAALGSAWLARTVARKHPAPAVLSAWSVIALAASLVLVLGRTAKGAEYSGTLAMLLFLPLLLAFTRQRESDASAWAFGVAGALHAILLFGLLQANALWISVVLLVVLAQAAGLIQLRTTQTLQRALAVAFVTALPAAAALFLAWFQAEAARPSSGLPY